jgi:predicted Zn-dependent peptidase
VSNKLFSIVREKHGLTYDITAGIPTFFSQIHILEYSIYDYYDAGLFTITVTPFADKIEQTKQETFQVLKEIKQKNISQQELDEVNAIFHLS